MALPKREGEPRASRKENPPREKKSRRGNVGQGRDGRRGNPETRRRRASNPKQWECLIPKVRRGFYSKGKKESTSQGVKRGAGLTEGGKNTLFLSRKTYSKAQEKKSPHTLRPSICRLLSLREEMREALRQNRPLQADKRRGDVLPVGIRKKRGVESALLRSGKRSEGEQLRLLAEWGGKKCYSTSPLRKKKG